MSGEVALTDAQRASLRMVLTRAMAEWSEDEYCAGWLHDLEKLLWQKPEWREVGLLLGEWPVWNSRRDEGWDGTDNEHRWLSLDEWADYVAVSA